MVLKPIGTFQHGFHVYLEFHASMSVYLGPYLGHAFKTGWKEFAALLALNNVRFRLSFGDRFRLAGFCAQGSAINVWWRGRGGGQASW